MADLVGVSRSALVERFARYLGETAMTEAAFNRAFKREFGLPPARCRRGTGARKETPVEPRRWTL